MRVLAGVRLEVPSATCSKRQVLGCGVYRTVCAQIVPSPGEYEMSTPSSTRLTAEFAVHSRRQYVALEDLGP